MASVREFDGTGALESAQDMRQALDDDGIFVVRNALSQAEIGELRDILLRYLPTSGQRFSLGKAQLGQPPLPRAPMRPTRCRNSLSSLRTRGS
jgi:hypothetical protein